MKSTRSSINERLQEQLNTGKLGQEIEVGDYEIMSRGRRNPKFGGENQSLKKCTMAPHRNQGSRTEWTQKNTFLQRYDEQATIKYNVDMGALQV
jgi:hypothetical protein